MPFPASFAYSQFDSALHLPVCHCSLFTFVLLAFIHDPGAGACRPTARRGMSSAPHVEAWVHGLLPWPVVAANARRRSEQLGRLALLLLPFLPRVLLLHQERHAHGRSTRRRRRWRRRKGAGSGQVTVSCSCMMETARLPRACAQHNERLSGHVRCLSAPP